MEGIYFYIFFWMIWIIATFFMKKTERRTKLAAATLMTMALSRFGMNIGSFRVTLSFLFLLVSAYYLLAARQAVWNLAYMFLATITITFAYTSFRLLALCDPIWIWTNPTWMMAIILLIISFMFYRDMVARFLCLIIGSCQGDVLYAFVLKSFSFPYIIGSFSFFDTISVCCFCLLGWTLLEQLPLHVDLKKTAKGTKQT
ncbi:YphA family membrane protein [Thermaerobacillus caldiproteolyticus]|uniref:YphA family membrane protein n=1 Tax=Thermaerobacillus caldiproteolyticus TaxID=247480 RepID=UPI0018F1F00F|nr:hypothetical protein [Anoxybacillus caldiproteolyticus]